MVPAQTNKDIAGYTTDELLHVVPETFGIKNFSRNITVCLLDDPVRVAMMFVFTLGWHFSLTESGDGIGSPLSPGTCTQ
jgi:hypothetical protein